MSRDDRLVLAVDGGNSKADLALVAPGGRLLAAVRGPTVSHQAVDLDAAMDRLVGLVRDLMAGAGLPPGTRPTVGVFSLAGADYPADLRTLRRAIERRSVADQLVVVNDTFGALRAGTDRTWGVALVCGRGVNAAAVAPDGRRAGYPAVGDIAGDWGGGGDVGMEGLAAAVRARDGRGPRTVLERTVPEHFGLRRPADVTRAMYLGTLRDRRVDELAPVVFAAAGDGDSVARSIVDRLADELAVMAAALMRRLRMTRLDPDVVLSGGVFRTREAGFYARLEARVCEAAPRARLVRLAWPPVAGAALLGLDRLEAETGDVAVSSGVAALVRRSLGDWDAEISGPANGFSR